MGWLNTPLLYFLICFKIISEAMNMKDKKTFGSFIKEKRIETLKNSGVLKMAEKCEADPKAIIGALDSIITEHVNG